ncbi:mRNA decay activator protein ZFP36-like [Microtus oregoni]|uniref:mRNA decay activator protein ZFP36-like n=1 Tax=Microtus oregoni TaxID=111838 RepID=UPI001BB1B767|nr:mRNA decay activator protein ZFP36-like [Microtus oregoni]
MAIRATMDLSAIYESLLSLNPDLSSDHGGTEPSALWSINSSDSVPSGVTSSLTGRSASLMEGRSCGWVPQPPGFAPLAPRPGLELSPSRTSPPATPTTSSLYKTELCRTYSESGRCRYGAKCLFAHGLGELRQANRHPNYKTELCHKFYLQGRCPYGSRCHFIPHPNEDLAAPGQPHVLRQSISFSGLPSGRRTSPPPPGFPVPSLSSCSFLPSSSPPPRGDLPLSPSAFSAAPWSPVTRRDPIPACCPSCRRSTPSTIWGPLGGLARSPSAHSLGSDPDDYASSGSSLSGSDSPVFEAGVFGPPQPPAPPRRLPIFNRISVSE